MTSFWLLMVLFMPATVDGLIMGWSQGYATEQACQVARAQALQQGGQDAKNIMITQCVEARK